MCHLRPLQWHRRHVMLPSDSHDMPKAGWFGCGSGVVRVSFGRVAPCAAVGRGIEPQCPSPALSSILCQCSCRSCLLGRVRWEYGHCWDPCSSSWRTGEFSDSTCGPADSEPEADVVDRHAKSGLETSKHISVQNKSCSLLEIACTHIRLCSKREAQRQAMLIVIYIVWLWGLLLCDS